jgi:Zn-dependent M28 family amino/carboxypeptidase
VIRVCRWLSLGLIAFACALGCDRNKTASASSQPAASPEPSTQAAATITPVGPAMQINPTRAWQYLKELLAFGPRWDGGDGQKKVGEYIHARLKGVKVEEDAFTPDTPAGKVPMRNIIAKFPGAKDGIIVLGSHIDTLYPLRNTNFVGANDGGSSTALLLAIADQLRGKKLEGYSVWLAFLDGEESIPSTRLGDLKWDDKQSLYGSRHLAQKWNDDGTAKKIQAFILLDMVGDKELEVLRDASSTPWLEDLIFQAAERLGYQSYFFSTSAGMEDDHTPFAKFGVPVADIIDFDYGYNNAFWHNTQDTIDKLSPRSLQIVGDVVLETIRLVNGRGGASAPQQTSAVR